MKQTSLLELTQHIIKSRRNIKPEQFSGKLIDQEKMHTIFESANWAPTHGYTEPWRFWIYSKNALKQFGQFHANLYKEHASAQKFKQVKYQKIIDRCKISSHVAVIGMKRGDNEKIPAIEELAAVACSVQNVWLAASAAKVACYWGSGGMTYHPAFKAHFNLAEADEILGLLYFGTFDGKWPEGKRLSPIDEKIKWSS